jgi:hypothetical protein
MLIEQEGRCAACSVATPKLQIDHCHETGRVRGLLCPRCNSSAGSVRDDPDEVRRWAARLGALADYLERA